MYVIYVLCCPICFSSDTTQRQNFTEQNLEHRSISNVCFLLPRDIGEIVATLQKPLKKRVEVEVDNVFPLIE